MQDKMKTLVTDFNGNLSVEEVSIPEYNECQALVKTVSCGVCNGTDRKLMEGTFKGFPEEVYPIMLGHEAVGRVVEIGSKVSTFKKGDMVLLPFTGETDGFGSGWGSYSEYGIIDDPQALIASGLSTSSPEFPESAWAQTILDPKIDPVKGAMIITLREVLSSIKRFGIKENESIVVFGCGPVGLTFIHFMKLLGVHPIVAVDLDEGKLVNAKEKGAHYTFSGKDDKLIENVKELFPYGVDFVLDAAGALPIVNQGMHLVRDGGKICCYGIAGASHYDIDWAAAPYNWQLHFQQMPSKVEEGEAHNQVMGWIEDGVIALDDYISDIVDFDNILKAFEMLAKGKIEKKCIIRYE